MSRFGFAENEPLGDGGFGDVYRAYRVGDDGERLEGEYAIKLLKRHWCENSEAVARFQREVRLQDEELDHSNVMPVLARNLSADPPYFVMPLATHSLRDELDNDLVQDRERALSVFENILQGVAHAHEREVLHRDLKPENVLFVDGTVRVTDFGL
jgi:serine/threonine-protein kinase